MFDRMWADCLNVSIASLATECQMRWSDSAIGRSYDLERNILLSLVDKSTDFLSFVPSKYKWLFACSISAESGLFGRTINMHKLVWIVVYAVTTDIVNETRYTVQSLAFAIAVLQFI